MNSQPVATFPSIPYGEGELLRSAALFRRHLPPLRVSGGSYGGRLIDVSPGV